MQALEQQVEMTTHCERELIVIPTEIPKHRFFSKTSAFGEFEISVEELEILSRYYNDINRPISPAQVEFVKRKVEGGEYRYPHPVSLIIDWNGKICDGGHRIYVHFMLKRPLRAYVFYGQDPAIREEKGAELPLTVAQRSILRELRPVTTQETKKRSSYLAVARVLWSWKHKNFKAFPKRYELVEVEDILQKNYSLIAKACETIPDPDAKNFKRAGFRAALAIYYAHDQEKAARFASDVNGPGANLQPSGPALRCRNILDRKGAGAQNMINDFKKCLWLMNRDYLNLPVGRKIYGLNAWKSSAVSLEKEAEETN